jgi:hypothetical protein
VIGFVQLSAINQPVLAEGIDGWDARISSAVWGELNDDGWIYDPASQSWRAAILSGQATLIKSDIFTEEDWLRLKTDPKISDFLDNGFEYIYIDENWWNDLQQQSQEELNSPCVEEVAEVENVESDIFRKLIRISTCY